MSNEAPFQINLKTPGGTLLNIRAWTEQELDIYIDALQLRIPDIQTLEQVVNSGGVANAAIANLQAAGLNPQPVAAPIAPAAPAHNYAPTPPAPAPVAGASPNCDHGTPMRFVPAGISKAGKPYKSFYACAQPRESACSAKA
jgi:hypothetical protein